MNRHVRVFEWLLRAYPEPFRSAYAIEMTRLFADQLRDATESGASFAVARVWVDSLIDVLMTAPGQHLQKEARVPQPVDLPSGHPADSRPAGLGQGPRMLLGLLPVWLLMFLAIGAPGFMDPAFANPPSVVGLPVGVIALAMALGVTAAGVVLLRSASSMAAATAVFLLLVVPATLVVLMTPALILVLINVSVN